MKGIATALGLTRQDMAQYMAQETTPEHENPPIFPELKRRPLPLERSGELEYMVEVKQELLNRFRESPLYLERQTSTRDMARYTDKYRTVDKDHWQPDWRRLPAELSVKKKRTEEGTDGERPKKRRRSDQVESVQLQQGLEMITETETGIDQSVEENVKKAVEEEEDEARGEGEDELSDEDYLEEDNDYVHSYYDNGEQYGDAGSDDNLDDDAVY